MIKTPEKPGVIARFSGVFISEYRWGGSVTRGKR